MEVHVRFSHLKNKNNLNRKDKQTETNKPKKQTNKQTIKTFNIIQFYHVPVFQKYLCRIFLSFPQRPKKIGQGSCGTFIRAYIFFTKLQSLHKLTPDATSCTGCLIFIIDW